MKNDAKLMRDHAALAAARRILRVVRPPSTPYAPYDLVYTGGVAPVYVLARSRNGKVGVTVRERQHLALSACGLAAYLVGDALIPLADLVGVAHVHPHHLDGRQRSIVFRVLDGKPAAPRFCFGKCDGPLR